MYIEKAFGKPEVLAKVLSNLRSHLINAFRTDELEHQHTIDDTLIRVRGKSFQDFTIDVVDTRTSQGVASITVSLSVKEVKELLKEAMKCGK